MAATVKPAVAKLLGEDVVLYCGASLPCVVFDLVLLITLSSICGVVKVGTLCVPFCGVVMVGIVTGT